MHVQTIRKHNLLFNKLNDNQDDQIHEMMKIKISKCQMHLEVKIIWMRLKYKENKIK